MCVMWNAAERKGQRREPAADDAAFVSERIGWLPFAAPCWALPACVATAAPMKPFGRTLEHVTTW